MTQYNFLIMSYLAIRHHHEGCSWLTVTSQMNNTALPSPRGPPVSAILHYPCAHSKRTSFRGKFSIHATSCTVTILSWIPIIHAMRTFKQLKSIVYPFTTGMPCIFYVYPNQQNLEYTGRRRRRARPPSDIYMRRIRPQVRRSVRLVGFLQMPGVLPRERHIHAFLGA